MKRSGPLRRKTPLKASTGLSQRRSRLKPVSDKKQAVRAADAERVAQEGAAFHAAIKGERCVVCGRSKYEAWRETGYGHHSHHAIRQEVLRRLGLRHLLWDTGLAVCVCEEPCHRQHTTRHRRIRLAELPDRCHQFAARHGLEDELAKECA